MSRGINVAGTSWRVLTSEPKLLVYPAIALAGQALALGAFVAGVLGTGGSTDHITASNAVATYLYFVASTTASVWAAAGISVVVRNRLEGGTAPWTIGFSEANKRLPALIGWAALTSLVTLALRVLEDKLGWLGKLLTIGGELAWSVATLLVVPVMVFEDEGPVGAVGRSARLFKARWGEGLSGGFANGVRLLGLWIVGALLVLIGFGINPLVGLVMLAFCVVSITLISDALTSVFTTALYSYAKTGELPRYFSASELACVTPRSGDVC